MINNPKKRKKPNKGRVVTTMADKQLRSHFKSDDMYKCYAGSKRKQR